MEWQVILTLFGSFAILLTLGIPVSFAIGLSSLATILMSLPLEPAIAVVAQRMAAGLDNFALLAIPFFILAGNIMNQGGDRHPPDQLCQGARRTFAGFTGPCKRYGQYDVRLNFGFSGSFGSSSGRYYVSASEEGWL